jgi:hypothetical protein
MTDDNSKTDSRPALRERLRAVEEELARLARRQEILLEFRERLRVLIANEDMLHGEGDVDETTVPPLHPTGGNRSLSDYILRALATGPKTLEQLKQVGSHWGPLRDSNSPGRALNFALVGLQKGKYVERLKDGSWKAISVKSESETPR